MVYLVLAILASVAIANILKFSLKKNITDIFWGNYLVAFLFSYYMAYQAGGFVFGWPELICGAFTGILFIFNFFIYNKNIDINGLSLSVGIMRISLVVPVVFSVIFFRELISFMNITGILIILYAFYIISGKKPAHNKLFLIFLFLMTGMADFSLKFYETAYGADMNTFLFFLFFTAFIINSAMLIKQKRVPLFSNVLTGFMVGIPNQLTSLFFLMGLKEVPAVISYPFFGSGVVLVSVLCDKIFWKAKFTLRQKIGYALIVLGIILLNEI
ncbi:MAG: hypothetical protein ACQESP_06110 [Candidatus Muiribacteriota bacterium]